MKTKTLIRIAFAAFVFSLLQPICIYRAYASVSPSPEDVFVFKPQDVDGRYTDTANWVNGDYPGTTLGTNDSIKVEKNGPFKKISIDTNLLLIGHFSLGDSMQMVVEQGRKVQLNSSTAFYNADLFSSAKTSKLQIYGEFVGYGLWSTLSGCIEVYGSLSFPAWGFDSDIGSEIVFDSSLYIKGNCTATGGTFQAPIVIVDNGGYFSRNWSVNYLQTITNCQKFTNRGTSDIEGFFYTGELTNEGLMTTNTINAGNWVNKGEAYIDVFHIITGYAGSSGLVFNYGLISTSGRDKVEIGFIDVVNYGDIVINAGPENDLASIMVQFSGSLINKGNIGVSGGLLALNGSMINDDSLTVSGRILVSGHSFINNGVCDWETINMAVPNEIIGNFLNTGTINNKGLLVAGHNFINAGNLNITQ